MANFRTHIGAGVIVSGMLATFTMAASIVPADDLIKLAITGAIGSVLPDIDLQNSRASQAMFNMLALITSFIVLFHFAWSYSIAEMWIIWVGTFTAVRVGVFKIFHKFSIHRGIFHSIVAGVFFAILTAVIFIKSFNASTTLAWLAGVFMFVGYMLHLLLDEIYSVDFNNNRVKRSFGTAMKLFDAKHPLASASMAGAAVLAFVLAPELDTFVSVVGDREIWVFLIDRMLPEESWFGFVAGAEQIAAANP